MQKSVRWEHRVGCVLNSQDEGLGMTADCALYQSENILMRIWVWSEDV